VYLTGNPLSNYQIETYFPLLRQKGVIIVYQVPEPVSLMLLGSGVLFLNLRRRQRNAKW
jgi:hypothetical protein